MTEEERQAAFVQMFEDAEIGDIFVSKGKRALSRLICWVLQSPYSHVLIKSSDTDIIESNDFGVNEVAFTDFAKKTARLENLGFPGDSEQRQVALKEIRNTMGREYDWLLVLGGVLSRIFHRSRKRTGLFNHKDRYICSEVIAVGLIAAGFILPFPPSQITPEDLYYYITDKNRKDNHE